MPMPKDEKPIQAAEGPCGSAATPPAHPSGAGQEPKAVGNGETSTGFAPPFRALEGIPGADGSGDGTGLPEAGQRIGDFANLELLGEGSFGKVFLARQISLDRLVALKVTALVGSEARLLASLEHDHIVRVFSEEVDQQRNWRLL